MKKDQTDKAEGALLPEYDLSKLKGGNRGKYHRQATAGATLVLIEPDRTVQVAEAVRATTKPKDRRLRQNHVDESG